MPRKVQFDIRHFVEPKAKTTCLHWPEVVGGRHEILAEDRDPFDVSLPFGLETSRRRCVRRLQKGAEEG